MTSSWNKASFAVAAAFCWAGSALADINVFANAQEFDQLAQDAGFFPNQTFRTSDIQAPVYHVNTWDKEAVDDARHIFLGTVYGSNKAGPMILDASDLSLVYADQQYGNTYTSQVVTVGEETLLAFWEGYHTRGHANGYCLFYDSSYHQKYNVTAKGLHGALADMHELKITQDRTVIFSTYYNIQYNCTPVGGPDDALLQESGFQEVDIETNEVIFEWSATNWFGLEDTFAQYNHFYGVTENSGFDFFHINSIDKNSEGNYLVSSRHCSLLTLIDGKDGHPIWQLGGKKNQFEDLSGGNATNFGWQHDARFFNSTHVTMFDNHGENTGFCEGDCHTRGLHLEIDTVNKTARLAQEFYHPEKVDSGAMGGLQHLDNGNVLMGWGYQPSFVEYKPDGTAVLDVQRGALGKSVSDMFAYRVHKGNWVGKPTWAPSIAVDSPHKSTVNGTVYVSWNGATEVKRWFVLASDDSNNINGGANVIKSSDRTGFETKIALPAGLGRRYLGVAAVDKDGQVLGSTQVIDMVTSEPFLMMSDITDVSPPSPPRPSSTPTVNENVTSDESQEEMLTVEPSPSPATPTPSSDRHETSAGFSELALVGALGFLAASVCFSLAYLCGSRRDGRPKLDDEKGVYTIVGGK